MSKPDYIAPVSYEDLAAVIEPDAERVALVAWLREQHAAARLPQLDVFASAFARGLELAYQRVLERLGEKP